MQLIDGTTISINRGNSLTFEYKIKNGDEYYVFINNDAVTFSIYNAYCMDESALVTKTFYPSFGDTSVTISLTSDEMKIGDMNNLPIDYWYEITLNDETVTGYDDNGPKIITIYPEGKEREN